MTTLREAAQQALEQTLEQEPSNPKKKEMTDPNSTSFNLNTAALPVEWLRLDGSGFHYKGKVIEDAGEAYDLFKEWLAHQQPSAQPLTELPPLPEVLYWSTRDDDTPLFTADQMRAYGRAVEAEVLKRMGVQK